MSGKDIIETLVGLLAEQEQLKITRLEIEEVCNNAISTPASCAR